jgi:hypothetical protein
VRCVFVYKLLRQICGICFNKDKKQKTKKQKNKNSQEYIYTSNLYL